MFDLIPYQLPLKRPLHLAGGITLETREGLLLHDPDGGGWGEAAPLPGFSPESLEEVRAAAEAGQWDHPHLPSLRFAVSCARTPWPPPANAPLVNALWQPAAESLEDFLTRIASRKQPVVKIKTVSAEDLDAVLALLGARGDVRVRLDPNRQWTLEQTLSAYERLPAPRLDYLEEPLRNPADYEALWCRAPVPIALDETLSEAILPYLVIFPYMVAAVIKPTLLGPPGDWPPIPPEKRIILSSAFESRVGLQHLARLAPPGEAHGLDTAQLFAAELNRP